ncbi:MAG: hypothetical protein ACJ72J_09750 [Nitrososphaeraceae archaeon]
MVDRSRSSSNNDIDDQIEKNDRVLNNVIDNGRKDFGELRRRERRDHLILIIILNGRPVNRKSSLYLM